MILASSALVALLRRERGHERLAAMLGEASTLGVGAPTLLEAGFVLDGRSRSTATGLLDAVLDALDLEVVPFAAAHRAAAHRAFVRFGKGRHPAALNYGDCMAYAVAAIAERPLLCVGDDFSRTDLEVVTW